MEALNNGGSIDQISSTKDAQNMLIEVKHGQPRSLMHDGAGMKECILV